MYACVFNLVEHCGVCSQMALAVMSLLCAQKQGKKNSGIETRSGSEPGQRLVEQGFSLKWQFKIIKRAEILQRKILFSIVMGCGT